MTIAAHIHSFDTGESFLSEMMKLIAIQQPGHHFILFSEKEPQGQLPANCTPVSINPKLKNRLLLHYWYNYKLPGLLQRYAANIFLSENGVLSLGTIIPQAMLLLAPYEELIAEEQNGLGKYRKKYFSKFVEKAQNIFVSYPNIGASLKKKYPAFSGIIDLPAGLNECFRPYSYEEKQEVREKFAGGKEYFVCIVPASAKEHTTIVLKAFSIFKKWQKSGMQLVLLAPGIPAETVVNNFSLYKYKDDVKIISQKDGETPAALIASAYACIYLYAGNSLAVAGLYPLKCGVPLITAANENSKLFYADAVLYTAMEASSLSGHIIELYRNEDLKQDLQKKGLALTQKNNWENSCKLFCEAIGI
ncbi:MAG: hypothetical protein WAT19_12250 [Ferruginibacter sp.]